MGWFGLALGYLVFWLKGFTMALLSQFKFPSPFTRAYLNSQQLVQEALESLNIGPFQSDGEFLCMCFLKPSEDPPNAEGLGSRPWCISLKVTPCDEDIVHLLQNGHP